MIEKYQKVGKTVRDAKASSTGKYYLIRIIMDHNVKSSEVVFLLGAGASVAAGVPDTYSFVKKFIESIDEQTKKETIEKIVQILEAWKKSDIDVELLLETLVKLKDKKQEPLLQFYDGGNFILKGYAEKKPLIDDLKDFIKSKAIVSGECNRFC
ncbi:Uncharacterised protein [uncultured archaeon]|nr:Uncharacterised protein [uncultured archaeon]